MWTRDRFLAVALYAVCPFCRPLTRTPYSEYTTHGRPIRLPLGCFILLTPCPHSPMLIDLSASPLPSKAHPIGAKAANCSSFQRAGTLVRGCGLTTNDLCRPPPDLYRSEHLGQVARSLTRPPQQRASGSVSLFVRWETANQRLGNRRPHSRQSPRQSVGEWVAGESNPSDLSVSPANYREPPTVGSYPLATFFSSPPLVVC